MASFKGKEILGILMKAQPTKLETKTVIPSSEEQIVLPSEGYNALRSVTVKAVEQSSGTIIPSGTLTITQNGTYDVSGNPGDKSFVALLPTNECATLECGKGSYTFYEGISRNQVYLERNGGSIEESSPLIWNRP